MASAPRELRPAFYSLRRGGWRDLITVLHPPYTAWHLSYVALGAAAAPVVHLDRLGAALGAFFLAVGVSAHALDELNGQPARHRAVAADADRPGGRVAGRRGGDRRRRGGRDLAAARAAGGVSARCSSPPTTSSSDGGAFTTTRWFALAWGAFPAFTGFFSSALRITAAGVLVSVACFLLSVAQRRLSTPVRRLRRQTLDVQGSQRLRDGQVLEVTRETLAAPLDGALSALWLAMVVLAVGLVAVRV